MLNPVPFDNAISSRLSRLAALQGTDPGLFVLAVHSFVEGWLRERIQLDEFEDDSFYALVEAFIDKAKMRNGGWVPALDVLNALKGAHKPTNDVRHRFAALDVAQARSATQHLKRFCQLANIPSCEELARLDAYLKAWDDRKAVGELQEELAALKKQMGKTADEVREKSERLAALEYAESDSKTLREKIKYQDLRLAELEKIKDAKDAKVDELRKERAALVVQLKAARKREEQFASEREYIDRLARLTNYTRTRADYERSITRLTQEQKKVLERINLNEDFLIKGSAGTGKTLVLLKAIEKTKSGQLGQAGLDLPEIEGSVALLTYTTTLVKYDLYVAALLSKGNSTGRVATADSFLIERLREVDRGIAVDYRLPEQLAGQFPAAGLSPKDLSAEIEGFIWGNDITYDEYVVAGIERRGMKRPLMKEQRQAVWSSLEAWEASMEARKTWTRNRAALLLARAVAAGTAPAVTRTDFIFIDEAQDLPAAVLKALKCCAKRAVILAGDADQSIYQPGFSFKRAGLDIAGRTRILRTNFRNTVQLHEIAERYRHVGSGVDDENQPEAFREGPVPELFESVDVNGMHGLLQQRIGLFLNSLGYSPENICVVVPRDDDLQAVKARLGAEGLPLVDIRDKSFDFQDCGSVRLTTMHSAKGLDFPVVLLFLPQFHVMNSSLDPSTSDRMARNLIYVAMTRAMDHLNVFLREGTENPALKDLASCFSNMGQAGGEKAEA
ncbi:MAG: ATP-binding domain-containing protein [Spirochaetaceae bacterium]|nr:ATP-binding domain-containing protein [Spirochaetaceae bacterium]